MGPQLRNLWVPVGFRLENLPKGRFSGVFALKLRKLHLEVWVISYFIFEPGGSPKTALRSWIRCCFPLKCILAPMHVSQRIQFETFYCLLMKHFWASGVSLRAILDDGRIDGWNPHPNHNLDHRLRTFAAVRFCPILCFVLSMPFTAWMDERDEALAALCIGKARSMDLGNHKTAWFALQALPEPHKTELRKQGYGQISHDCHLSETILFLHRISSISRWIQTTEREGRFQSHLMNGMLLD